MPLTWTPGLADLADIGSDAAPVVSKALASLGDRGALIAAPPPGNDDFDRPSGNIRL